MLTPEIVIQSLASGLLMGLLYGVSLTALVAFGILAQLAAAIVFLRLRQPLAEAAAND